MQRDLLSDSDGVPACSEVRSVACLHNKWAELVAAATAGFVEMHSCHRMSSQQGTSAAGHSAGPLPGVSLS